MFVTTTRFAPSPTGLLHLGHAYSAMLSRDFARARGGRFLLRIEDIDPGRTREAFVDAIVEDLTWLGLDWDGPVLRQSARLDHYQGALERLGAMGLLYPCFCTRRDIAQSVSAPHADLQAGEAPAYPGTCRGRDLRHRLHEPHCWRIDMARATALAGPLHWNEKGRAIPCTPLSHGDVVLARKDAPASYHLAVTIDDAAQGVTDIVRGEDLMPATHIHRLLQRLLDLPEPHYHHHRLLTGPDGRRLAKRDGALPLAELRRTGANPTELLAQLRASS